MGGIREAEMPASIAILGLLIEQPDDVRGLERRLNECFPLARFAPTTAHNAVKRLRKQGHVDESGRSLAESSDDPASAARRHYAQVRRALREGRVDAGAAYATRGLRDRWAAVRKVYEPTSPGVRVFQTWMGSSCPVPAVREELRAKMVFARPEDLPRLVELVQDEIRACAREYEAVHTSVKAIEDHRAHRGRTVGEEDWSLLTGMAVIRDDAAFWMARRQRLERTCVYLEGLREEAARRSVPAHLRRR